MSYHFETPALLNSYEIKHGFSEIRYALDIEQNAQISYCFLPDRPDKRKYALEVV